MSVVVADGLFVGERMVCLVESLVEGRRTKMLIGRNQRWCWGWCPLVGVTVRMSSRWCGWSGTVGLLAFGLVPLMVSVGVADGVGSCQRQWACQEARCLSC